MEASGNHISYHFSHHHSLELTVSPSNGNDTCKGCNLKIMSGKDFYHCKTCSFSLHPVCSNMPRRKRHALHPNHYLTLLASASFPASTTLECKACGNFIRGFYYSCDDCGVYFHILCLALPLSVTLATHPHSLKMEFLPPYEFICDLCDEPSNKGWLYRCRFCEFDAHISCAISNQKPHPLVPGPDTLTRNIIYSSAYSLETNRKIDYGGENRELMELLVQGVAQEMWEANETAVIQPAIVGWDERLRSPVQNFGDGRLPQLLQTPERDQAPLSPLSQDATIPSYQFSDFCFSIDLLNSYAICENRDAMSKDTSSQDIIIVPEPGIEAKIRFDNVAMASKKLGNGHGMQRLDPSTKQVNNPLYGGPENWLDATPEEDNYVLGGRKEMGQGGYGSKSNLTHQRGRTTDDSSGWWSSFSCCYSSRYKRGSKSFHNGGL